MCIISEHFFYIYLQIFARTQIFEKKMTDATTDTMLHVNYTAIKLKKT